MRRRRHEGQRSARGYLESPKRPGRPGRGNPAWADFALGAPAEAGPRGSQCGPPDEGRAARAAGEGLRNNVLAGGPRRSAGRRPLPSRGRGGFDRAAGSVGGPLGQTGRLGLATDRSAWEERRGVCRALRAWPSRPWRPTRRPEEPPTRTPAQGRPAGALRWRVWVANRSGEE
ncbi:hypothetical protein Q5P01_000643 [Channa striata]|uniref:Uncharacterized protein n=1 Tax=Channa striata TaxID=64152 RepID=A0AA88LIY7_CHASR|nr:hypothetical protein Q5P01_000643 [Channa striata]